MDSVAVAGESKKLHLGRQYLCKCSCFVARWHLLQANEQSLEILSKDCKFLCKRHAQGQSLPPVLPPLCRPSQAPKGKGTYFVLSKGTVREQWQSWCHLPQRLSHTEKVGAFGGDPWLGDPRSRWPRQFWDFPCSALLLGVHGDGKSAVPYLWSVLNSCFWKALRQSRYVCSPMSPPEKPSKSAGMEPNPHYSCWTAWGTWALPLWASEVSPVHGTSVGHVFQSAVCGTKT